MVLTLNSHSKLTPERIKLFKFKRNNELKMGRETIKNERKLLSKHTL